MAKKEILLIGVYLFLTACSSRPIKRARTVEEKRLDKKVECLRSRYGSARVKRLDYGVCSH